MKKILAELPIRRIILVSIILGGLLGSVNIEANLGPPSCTPPPGGCTNEGCHNSRPDGQGYQVCLFSGNNCPPLTQCQ